MRVLHVLSTLAPAYGGPVEVCRQVAEGLAARGHEVSVFTTNLDWPPSRPTLPVRPGEVRLERGVRVRYFGCAYRPMQVSPTLALALSREIAGFDLVHVHGIYRFPQIAAARAARRAGVPYWVRPYGSLDPYLYTKPERRRMKRIFEKLFAFPMINNADRVHYTTRLEQTNSARHGFRAKPIVMPNGIDRTHYGPLPRGRFRQRYGLEGKLILLFLGRLTPKKGLDLLLAAAAPLARQRPELRVAIVGPDNEGFADRVRGWAAEQGIADRIVLTGMLTGEDKLAALADADLFALPSRAENFSVACAEAMAAGLPVVVSDEVGIAPEIEAAGAGIVTPCAVEPFGEALRRLVTDGELRRLMGSNSRIAAAELFDWDRIVPRLEAEYAATIDEVGGRRPARRRGPAVTHPQIL